MTPQPFVSVGLPVYNGERYLASVIESHLVQTHTNFELIVSDNASTDATPAICDDYARRDARIRYVRSDRNLGLTWNHANVLEHATGPYFRWAASDDLITPGLIAEAVTLLEADPRAVLVVPHTRNIDAEGQVTATLPRNLHLATDDVVERGRAVLERPYQMVFLQGLMRRNTMMCTRRGWDYFGWDFVLMLELALRGRVLQTQHEHLQRRLHPGQASRVQRDAKSGVTRIEPTFSARWVFPHWRWQCERFRTVAASPIGAADKRRLIGFIAQQTWWSRGLLMHDVMANFRMAFAGSTEMPL